MQDNQETAFLGVRCRYCESTITIATIGKLPNQISLPCDHCGRRGMYARAEAFAMPPAEARKRLQKRDQVGFGRRSTR
jgi:hypothetical protein